MYNVIMNILTRIAVSFLASGSTAAQDRQKDATSPFLKDNFRWRSSEPLLAVNPERLQPSPDTAVLEEARQSKRLAQLLGYLRSREGPSVLHVAGRTHVAGGNSAR